MKYLTLLYHDVVDAAQGSFSGFVGADADVYKLERTEFERHLNAIAAATSRRPGSVIDAVTSQAPQALLLTFDDGGAGAFPITADLLDARGWVGHFLVTSNFIGTHGFLTEAGMRELRKRGHVIGSHSCSHPTRMANCSRSQLQQEWSDSCARISDIIGEAVTVASVPGGYYSRVVAETAAEAGIRVLFNSEPVTAVGNIGGCAVIGRFGIQRDTPPYVAAALAGGAFIPRAKQYAYWNLKKAVKAVGGSQWLRLRKYLLEQRANKADDSRSR